MQLSFNLDKCAVVSLPGKPQYILCNYFTGNMANPGKKICENVTVSVGLSFERHVNNSVSKAGQRVTALFGGFLARNLNVMRQALVTYVRLFLKYNTIAWNSICSCHWPAFLDLILLKVRRLWFDFIYYYNLTLFNVCDVLIVCSPDTLKINSSQFAETCEGY